MRAPQWGQRGVGGLCVAVALTGSSRGLSGPSAPRTDRGDLVGVLRIAGSGAVGLRGFDGGVSLGGVLVGFAGDRLGRRLLGGREGLDGDLLLRGLLRADDGLHRGLRLGRLCGRSLCDRSVLGDGDGLGLARNDRCGLGVVPLVHRLAGAPGRGGRGGDRQLDAARRAEAGVAGVERAAARTGASDAGLADLEHPARWGQAEPCLQRRDLLVGGDDRVELPAHESLALLAEAVQVEHQATEVAQLEVAELAQVAQAPAGPAPGAGSERRGGLRRASGGAGGVGGAPGVA